MNSFLSKLLGASESIRLPRFAGTWYPEQANVLDQNLSNYLEQAKAKTSKQSSAQGRVLAIIVPHAGYMFSGKTAAFAYGLLPTHKYKRVFLLGPSHHIPFRGAVLPVEEIFQTPLGQLQIDKDIVQKLLQHPYFKQATEVFDVEHSVELQLPWIYKTLGKVKLIPIAIGMVNAQEIKSMADCLKQELNKDDLVIVSSDFTHYGPRFDYQPFIDDPSRSSRQTRIKELDFKAYNCLKTLDSQNLLDFYTKTGDTICGIYPAALLLDLLPPASQAKLLNYSTSQDTDIDKSDNSVSYMAIAFSAPNSENWAQTKSGSEENTNRPISATESKILLKLAHQALADYLKGQKKEPSAYMNLLAGMKSAILMEKRGVFVTLYKRANGEPDKQLRGCIGYIYPQKTLLVAVCENVINAASSDPRFKPVTLSELSDLIIEISVLTAPHFIADWQQIKLGEDGIVLHKAGRQAVFLPKVAKEFGWDLPQTLSQLSLKAGLSMYDWQNDAQFEIFQSQSFSQ